MFERYNEQARRIIILAQEEARALNHHYVGAEHLLLAMTRDDNASSVAARTLAAINVSYASVLALLKRGGGETGNWHLPLTPQAKEVLDTAWHQAGNDQVSAEHFLLALARQRDGVPARAFSAHSRTAISDKAVAAAIDVLPYEAADYVDTDTMRAALEAAVPLMTIDVTTLQSGQ